MRARQAVALLLLCTLALTGCYQTGALVGLTPSGGTRVLAELTPAGAEALTEIIGAEAVAIEGTVLAARSDTLRLAVIRVDHRNAPSAEWNEEQVGIPTTAIAEVRERRLDWVRTGALIGGVVAVATALAVSFVQFEGSGGGGNGGGVDPAQ